MKKPFETIDARLTNIECLLLDLKDSKNPNTNNTGREQLLTTKKSDKLLNLSIPIIYRIVKRETIYLLNNNSSYKNKANEKFTTKSDLKSKRNYHFQNLGKLLRLLIRLFITLHLFLGSLKQTLSSDIFKSVPCVTQELSN